MSDLLVDKAAAVVTVTINRPLAANALNHAVLSELHAVIDKTVHDPSVRAVVITGSGEKVFSAGADLKELADMTTERAYAVLTSGQSVLRELERSPVPVITAVNGVALGGGFELVLASTIPVMSTTASLGLPESGLGLMPGYGGHTATAASSGLARRSAPDDDGRLSAARAYDLGLTPVPPVPPASLPFMVREIAEAIASQGPTAVRSILQALETARDASLDDGLALEAELAAQAVGGRESTEGIGASTSDDSVFADARELA